MRARTFKVKLPCSPQTVALGDEAVLAVDVAFRLIAALVEMLELAVPLEMEL